MSKKVKEIKIMLATLMCSLVFALTGAQTTEVTPVRVVFEDAEVETIEPVIESTPEPKIIEEPVVEEEILTQEEIELIALVTMAEAEGEPEEGQRLVIDTILNRVDSEFGYFPDTVHEVIYQKNAFSSMWDGRADRCYVMEELCQLVREELDNRTNKDVLYFTAGGYGRYGTPAFNVANHYFCEA
jgi:N-acetylmuramoyl-L-alanine amidase